MKKCYKFLYSLVSGIVVRIPIQELMSSPTRQHYKYTFGAFTLDTRRGALEKQGEDVKIRAQSFQVLALLLRRHGILVSKEDLHRDIWGNKVVSDDSITHCMLDIRKCLGDVDKSMIRTIPRRGYVFEAPCQQESLSATNDDSLPPTLTNNKPALLFGAALATAIVFWLFSISGEHRGASVPDNSIAVLPFADISESQDQRYLANGLADEILNLLARSPDLRVIARTSSFSFVGKATDIATIRDKLNVAYVLEGSVSRTQGRLTITAQLVDTATSSNTWSNSYEGRPENLVALQKKIADAVLLEIAPDADDSVISPAQRSFSADELMLLGRFYEQEVRERPEVDEKLLKEAIGLYKDAIQADPTSALAHSRLAGAMLYAGDLGGAEGAALKAYSLDQNLSEVQETLGEYYWARGLPGAGAAWKRAIELNPNNADALSAYAHWYWMQGNDDGPEELFRRAMVLDPLSLSRHAALGEFLAHEARVEKTLEVVKRIQTRFESPESFRVIARLLEVIGKIDASIAWTIKARDRDPRNSDHVSALAELYAEIGDTETALTLEPEPSIGLLFKMRQYDAFIDKAELEMIEEPDDILLRYLLAFAYNASDEPSAAIRILETVGQPLAQRMETRLAAEVEGFVVYVDALNARGDRQQASELAEWFDSKPHTESANWWIHVYRACLLSILRRDEEALVKLERVTSSPRLPWETTIRDMQCFQRYENEPRYQAVLAHIDSRRAELRQRVPKTLSAHKVEL